MSTTVRHPFGDRSSDGTGKFAAALFTSTAGTTERVDRGVERGRDRLGVADVARDGEHRRAEAADRVARRVEVLGLAAHHDDRRAEPRELGGDRLAEPGAAAGDDDRDAVEGSRRQCGRTDGRRCGQSDQLGHEILSFRCSGARSSARAARSSAKSSLLLIVVW